MIKTYHIYIIVFKMWKYQQRSKIKSTSVYIIKYLLTRIYFFM